MTVVSLDQAALNIEKLSSEGSRAPIYRGGYDISEFFLILIYLQFVCWREINQ